MSTLIGDRKGEPARQRRLRAVRRQAGSARIVVAGNVFSNEYQPERGCGGAATYSNAASFGKVWPGSTFRNGLRSPRSPEECLPGVIAQAAERTPTVTKSKPQMKVSQQCPSPRVNIEDYRYL
jgi:hypothetical protein